MEDEKSLLISARNLVKEFPMENQRTLQAISDVDFDIYRGETHALVGESGCGKSTLGRVLIKLLDATSGTIMFKGTDLGKMKPEQFAGVRRQMQIIFQDPYASLNPRMNVCEIIAEPLITYGLTKRKADTEQAVRELMQEVGIPAEFINRYPHQFSGGQRQRIGIARAIALHPELIVCDEPVSALDVSIQSQVLNLLKDLQEQYHLTYLFISHDLSVVKFISDRVSVMFLGKICETASTEELFSHPLHPYTMCLMNAIPKTDPHARSDNAEILSGEIPSPMNPPSGCRFHTRCPFAKEICGKEEPVLQDVGGRKVACHFPME